VFQQVVLQNSKLWIYTQRTNLLVKTEIEAGEKARTPYKVADNGNMRQKRAKAKKMFVDKLGLHCFMLTGHEVYYNYYHSDAVCPLPVETFKGTQVAFKSIDILMFDENEPCFFELLLGSEDGHLFHGVFQVDHDTGLLNVADPLKLLLQTPEYSPILEIQMTKIRDTYLVLMISATMLYQMVGTSSLEYTLKSYAQDPKKLQTHSIVISEKPQKP
jgi:hypothetical protein